METWKRLADRYGRDYGWLEKAMQLYPCRTAQDGRRATVIFFPAGAVAEDASFGKAASDGDLGVPYGMPPGLSYCFLLENVPQTAPSGQDEKQRWTSLLSETEGPADGGQPAERVYCIPVKSGRPALGWQLGLLLLAIRPMALLRPFYLFGTAQPVRSGPCRTVPLADARRLGRLLEDGWLGVDCDATGTQVMLQRPASGARLML